MSTANDKCWNCQSALDEVLLCARCGMPQPVEFPDPFEAFGLAPRLSWDVTELQNTYERLALKCHPDLFRAHNDERVLKASRLAMRSLNDAHRVLVDPVSRLRHVLNVSGHTGDLTRTIPQALEESAAIIGRVLQAVEKATADEDREAWESQQDHLASLELQVEKAQRESDSTLHRLMMEWDDAVAAADGDWPNMPDGWYEHAMRWLGEREYLQSLGRRVRAGRRWLVPTEQD